MAKISDRERYRMRIEHLIKEAKKFPLITDGNPRDTELESHWAKYTCVLISGYIEQSVKEILYEHTAFRSSPRITRYIEKTWPKSKNMKCDVINETLENFDSTWSCKFQQWVNEGERKSQLNEIISWRNRIAHGDEASANNITLGSISTKFQVARGLVDFLESLITTESI